VPSPSEGHTRGGAGQQTLARSYCFLYVIVFPSLVSSSSVALTFILYFEVVPPTVHSSSSLPFTLYVPSTGFLNMGMVSFALPSLPNSAVSLAGATPAPHLPTIRFWGLEPQP